MKRITAIIILAILIVFPVVAGGMGEVYSTAAMGALSGAGIGSALGLPGIIIGAIGGAIVGAIGGSAIVESGIQEEEKKEEAQNISKIEEIEQITIPDIKSEISVGQQALARWQSSYDAKMVDEENTASKQLDALKYNWGVTNASLASQNRQGATARLLSQKKKEEVVKYAGEDMELNSEEAIAAARSVYEDRSNFDEQGIMTAEGAKKLKLVGSQYGVYEKDLFEAAAGLLSEKNAAEIDIESNKRALDLSTKSAEKLKTRNKAIQERRWW